MFYAGIILIIISFSTLISMIIPKLSELPILANVALYSLIGGFLLLFIGAVIK